MFKKETTNAIQNSKKTMERNNVAKNTSILGEIKSDGDFRIDGSLEGNLKINGRVVIGVDGSINGNVTCTNADIEGKFIGELIVEEVLTIKSTANISGNITIGKLSVEPGAIFNAECNMKGSGKQININDTKKPEKFEKTS
ncbi:polymer-forming cytoskeletal protein [Tenacibaculum sp. UWU-22]|uniref:bactofilin family protein n=1 Tax=Tenacibaculum sp. UWU-22 TaxID=3234187 RepID=UPI0034DB2275